MVMASGRVLFYSPDQERDAHGRFGSGDGEAGSRDQAGEMTIEYPKAKGQGQEVDQGPPPAAGPGKPQRPAGGIKVSAKGIAKVGRDAEEQG
jgi:hypothetical protein